MALKNAPDYKLETTETLGLIMLKTTNNYPLAFWPKEAKEDNDTWNPPKTLVDAINQHGHERGVYNSLIQHYYKQYTTLQEDISTFHDAWNAIAYLSMTMSKIGEYKEFTSLNELETWLQEELDKRRLLTDN